MDKDFSKITDEILTSYRIGGGMNNIDGSNLPSKRALATICEDLLQLLFPGFHDQEPIHSQHLKRVTSHRIYSIGERLQEEICKSLRLREPGCPEEKAGRVLFSFLETIPAVRQVLRTDVEAAHAGDPAASTSMRSSLRIPTSRPSPSSGWRTCSTRSRSRSCRA